MFVQYLVLFLTIFLSIVNTDPMYEDELRLNGKLLSNYTKHIRPVINLTTSVDINAELYLDELYDLDFVNSILKARFWSELQWMDELLRWNPLNYNNITRIYLPKDKIWIPSTTLSNSRTETIYKNSCQDVVVYSNGSVEMASAILLHADCEMNAYSYPFDKQMCDISIYIPTYEPQHIKIKKLLCSKADFLRNYQWDITLFCDPDGIKEKYNYANATMYLRRKLNSSTIAKLIPTIMMTILTIFVFVLPPESGEKVSLGTMIFLSNVLYLVEIEKTIPINSKRPSLLVLYLMVLSLLSGIATIGSVVISKLYVNQSSDNIKSHQSTMSSHINQVTDISIISKEESNPSVLKKDMPRKKTKKYIFRYNQLDDIFLKSIIIITVSFSTAFICLSLGNLGYF
ncbi:acetylcholine receptor subunit alpha-like 2 [Octopus sinensis]|uniref:Acetylcholine receptor subunit alpha-like 2 n=1 Tax=Octopus sinensis TaxID=2607531 RepID=A0A6P7T6T3_9MOLL|nr:acetylcholine receptor subunit alpha-like 2 [Octopus sinensis]